MSRALDLHRGREPVTGSVSIWLRCRGWSRVQQARGHSLWKHDQLAGRDFMDTTEAMIATVCYEAEHGAIDAMTKFELEDG